MSKPHILIAGAGIGGLTAALSLARLGYRVSVHEQANELREIGAGVQISANGMLVLRELGLADKIMALAAHPEKREVRMWNTGQAWTAFDLGAVSVATYGNPYVTMYRPDLLAVLVDAVNEAAPGAIHLGQRATGCDNDGEHAVLRLEGGGEARGDALIGADGIHSAIRATLHGADHAEFTGLVAWRGIIPMDTLPPRLARMVSSNWVGPGRHIVQYPVAGGRLMNFVGVVERTDWQQESWTTPDGFILARALDGHSDIPTALRVYEMARQERTARVVNGSADNTKRFHNPALADAAGAQAYVEREWAEDKLRERYDWMYRYDATTVAI